MASSEVEVVSSSSPSPFGCVLKDHNLRNRRPPTATPATSKGQPNLQKTLKELVREHLRSSISSPSNENSNSNQPTHHGNCSRPTYYRHHRGRSPNQKASSDTEARQASPIGRWKSKERRDFKREPSPALSDSSISCLVQKWRVLETSDPKQLLPTAPPASDDRIQDPVRSNSVGFDNDSMSDWESDQAPPSECLLPDEKIGDGGEKEKIRVVDIIRKLPLEVPLKQLRAGMPECGEGAALFSPRIRGRQALADLLARLARDRYEEVEALAQRHSVSNFPKRGRIQSLLKIRLLTREASAHNYRHYQEAKVYESSKSIQKRLSSVNSLRRRFNTAAAEPNGSENAASSNLVVEKVSTSNPPLDTAEASNDNRQEEVSLGQINNEIPKPNHQEKICIERLSTKAAAETTSFQQEEVEILNTMVKSESNIQQNEEKQNSETENNGVTATTETINCQQEEVEILDTMVRSESDIQQTEEEEEKENLAPASSSASTEVVQQDTTLLQAETGDLPREIPSSDVVWKENGSEKEAIQCGSPGRTDTLSHNVWEEEMFENEEYYDNDFFESSLDWIHDISRPRSYWESQRRSWYEEILESSSSTNHEIRQLIERGSVSAVLTSDFRDKMDQLMISSVQLQMDPIAREDEERPMVCRGSVSAILTSDFRERMDQLMKSSVQLKMDPVAREDEERPMVAALQRQMQSLSGSPEEEEEQNQDHEHLPVEEQVVIHGQESNEVEPIREEAIREEDINENEDIEEDEEEERLSYYREQTPLLELPWSSYQDQEDNDDLEKMQSATQHQESFNTNSYDQGSQVGEQLVIHGQESSEVEPVQEEAFREEDMDENEDIEDEDEEESLSDYREQTPLLELPWSSYQDQEDSDGDGLEQIESETHRQQSFITNSYNHGSQVGSSIKNDSITEMELICDIRGHMQQIYHEMSELRKVVSSCMDMQLKFQSSIRDEVSAAVSQLALGKTEGKESKRKVWKGTCCICREKKADSLLYRCGHMCTCFECGNKLQWSSGKCPICWAQIADVVRVCTD